MAEQEQDQKTEQPTGKRLDEAREQGQIPVSREASLWVSMLGLLVIVAWVLPSAMRDLLSFLRGFLETPDAIRIDEAALHPLFFSIYLHVARATGLIFALMLGAIVGGVMLQTGFFFALDLLKIDLMRLDPSRGLKRLFSITALEELGKGFLKLCFLGGVALVVLVPVGLEVPHLAGQPLPILLSYLNHQTVHLITILILPFTLIAAADLFFQRYQYIKNLRMTKAEIKDEHKQQEGDPMIKARVRQMRLDRARKRMMAQVPKADVVITNPTHYAVALRYDSGQMAAPVVLAKGINLIAERIRAVAEENKIPLVSNPPLARALYESVEIDTPIPAQHYRAVAEVISYVYKLRKKRGGI